VSDLADRTLARYVEPHGISLSTPQPSALTQTFSPPYDATGVRVYEFVLRTDPDALARICDVLLNEPSGGALGYKPLFPFVFLSFVDIARLNAAEPPQSNIGWFRERDVAFWFLTLATKHPERGQAIAGLPYYVFVDQPQALLTGREVAGWPKEWATIDMERRDGDPTPLTVTTVALPGLGADVEAQNLEILRVSRVPDPSTSGVAQVASTLESLLKLLWDELGAAEALLRDGLIIDVIEEIRAGVVPLVLLKQFRDVADGSRACYQAVVETPVRAMDFRSGGVLPGRYQVDIASVASHPIASDLGLIPASQASVKGFWLDFNYRLEAGRELWRAE
jgi:hypothetical protein